VIEPCPEALNFDNWFLRVDGRRGAYLHNDLIDPNNILKTCIALLKPFVQPMKIRHEFEVVILSHVNAHRPWSMNRDKPEGCGEYWYLRRKSQQDVVVCLKQRSIVYYSGENKHTNFV